VKESKEHEAHLSAQSNQEKAKARLSQPHEHQGGARDIEASPGEGARAPHGLGGFEAGLGAVPAARFRPADRVVSARDYTRIRRSGRRLASRNFAVTIAVREGDSAEDGSKADPGPTRLGMAVSRRVGNAVERNRIKRAIREWFRVSRDRLADSVDIVVIARPGAARREPVEIAQELNQLLAQ